MTLPATNTLLVLYGMGQPLYAARGLVQTLTPIAAAKNISRSINGRTMDLSYEQFRLYSSEITCSDFETPSLDNVWPGDVIVVDCACELSYLTSVGEPGRTVVGGSQRTDGAYTFYRPQLEMIITDLDFGYEEYGDEYSWKLVLEETGALGMTL